jgi:peptidyl-prolyl cis-trans isomerase C
MARQRLLHFVVLGGALFAIAPRVRSARSVEISSQALAQVHAAEARKLSVDKLDDGKIHEVDARLIEDEILYREALRLRLDEDDPIVRERLIQKLLLLVEDLGGASETPTDDALRAYFEANPSAYRQPDTVHFVHVFASTEQALPSIESLNTRESALASGEAFAYPREQTLSHEQIARLFGDGFAASLRHLDAGAITGPVRSTFGWHRVRVLGRNPGRMLTFDEAKAGSELLLDFTLARRERVVGAYLDRVAGEYDIRVAGSPLPAFHATRRVAMRTDPSAED